MNSEYRTGKLQDGQAEKSSLTICAPLIILLCLKAMNLKK